MKTLLLILGFFILHDVNTAPLFELSNCTDIEANETSILLSVRAKRNETGDWVNTFAAYGNAVKISDVFILDLKQTINQKKNKEMVLIQGSFGIVSPMKIKEEMNVKPSPVVTEIPIMFSNRTGKNIGLSNDGCTAERIKPMDVYNNGIVVADRALKDNELFEVRLDETVNKWAGTLDFGVTALNPTDIPLKDHFDDYSKENTWFYTTEKFKTDGLTVPDRWEYNVGDRFGVMRIANGELQFFINGILVGSSKSKVPKEVYAIIDIYGRAAKATIVNPL